MAKTSLVKAMVAAGEDGRAKRKVRGPRKEEGPRTGWNTLSEEELSREGAELLSMIYEEANRRGAALKDAAAEIGCTYGYIGQLRAGIRETKHISDEFAAGVARFCGRPKLDVLVASGRIKREDLIVDPETLDEQLDNAIRYLMHDKAFSAWVPVSIAKCDSKVKFLVVKLYEKASGKKLV